jgi:hypothetical protein
MTDKLYYARGLDVWKAPVRTKVEGGTNVTIGFHACTATEIIGEDGAQAIAELLTLGEQAQAGWTNITPSSPQQNKLVTDEMVEKAAAAYWLEVYGRHRKSQKWPEDVYGSHQQLFRDGCRAALSAALADHEAGVVAAVEATPTVAHGQCMLAAFEAAYPELYYHIAKGKICAGEPLYGAIITTMGTTEIGHGESNISADDALRVAIDNAGLSLFATEGKA